MKLKWRSAVKAAIPEPIKLRLLKGAQLTHHMRLRLSPVQHHSIYKNVYHCCVQRTASQWMKALFDDDRVYQYSGLKPFNTRILGIPTETMMRQTYSSAFPMCTLVGPLYIGYDGYNTIPKPEAYRAFFIMRDPRDVVVSHYFSSRYSHTPMGDLPERRKILRELSVEDGLIYTIQYLSSFGLFDVLRSWHRQGNRDQDLLLIRYEDMVGPDQLSTIRTLFAHCDIQMPEPLLTALLTDHSFKKVSGRKQGESDQQSHYRKGEAGDWQNYFEGDVLKAFREATGDLVDILGYSPNP